MSEIDSIIKLATENTTKLMSDRIILLSRIIYSLNKILVSFEENAAVARKPQETHLQVIENILYNEPNLFDDIITDKFFAIKNKLDAGMEVLPLAKEYRNSFNEILADLTKKKKYLKFRYKILIFIIYSLLILAFFVFVIIAIKQFKQ